MGNDSIIRKYYHLVDARKFEEMLNLFSNKAIYNRAGKTIRGMNQLKKFYNTDRKLKGKHTLNNLITKGNKTIVTGTFKGTNGKKQRINVDFADLFEIKRNLITKRQTYISSNSKLIE